LALPVLALTVALSTTGCGSGDSQAEPANSPATSTTSTADFSSGTDSDGDQTYPSGEETPTDDSSPEDYTAGNADAPLPSLRVTEKGWTLVGDGDYASWGAIIHNPGEDVGSVTITASGLDNSGNALETQTQDIFRIPGGADIPIGGLFTEAKGIKKVTIEVGDDFNAYEKNDSPVVGEVTSTTKVSGSGYDARVVVKATSTLVVPTKDGMPVCVVFRGARDKILGGACGFTPGSIRPGRTVSLALQESLQVVVPDGVRSASTFFDVSDFSLKSG
jgi:hypothetical protein